MIINNVINSMGVWLFHNLTCCIVKMTVHIYLKVLIHSKTHRSVNTEHVKEFHSIYVCELRKRFVRNDGICSM